MYVLEAMASARRIFCTSTTVVLDASSESEQHDLYIAGRPAIGRRTFVVYACVRTAEA